jgi:hypothetical protein
VFNILLINYFIDKLKNYPSEIQKRTEETEPVDQDAFFNKIREGTVTLLDMWPLEPYRAGHLPGALSITLKHLMRHPPSYALSVRLLRSCGIGVSLSTSL